MSLIKGHYVPCFYLRGFTVGGTETSDLFVLDLGRQRRWESTPKNTAAEHGFYATDEHVDPDFFEKKLGEVETQMSLLLSKTLASNALPTGAEWIELLGIVAVMLVRVPKYRDKVQVMRDAFRDVAQAFGRSDEEGRQAYARLLAEEGIDPARWPDDGVGLNDLDASDLLSPSDTFIQVMTRTAAEVVPILNQRVWTMWTCADDAPDLVCSDHPVTVTGTAPDQPRWGNVGIGSRGTLLTMPLNRRTLLVGSYEGPIRPLTLGREDVAAMNTPMLAFSSQVYSSSPEFVWARPDGGIGDATELIAYLENGGGEAEERQRP